MNLLLWSLGLVSLVTSSHALIQPAAAGFSENSGSATDMTGERAPAHITAKVPKFSRRNVHLYVAKQTISLLQDAAPQSTEHLKDSALHKGHAESAAAITNRRVRNAAVLDAGKPSLVEIETPAGWPATDNPKVEIPPIDIQIPKGWPLIDTTKPSFTATNDTDVNAATEHENQEPTSGSPPDPALVDTTPSSSNTPSNSGESSTCSKTDSSASAVLHCVNSVRTNPRAFIDGYQCSWQSWIDSASSPQRPAFTVDTRLRSSAQGHADWMAQQTTVSHTGKDGSTVAQRIKAAGYTSFPQAENVAGGQRSAYEVTMEWMCSEGHRNTIINCDYDNIGTGVATDTNGRIYYAQNFGASVKCGNRGCQC